jgi:hypothetical protein
LAAQRTGENTDNELSKADCEVARDSMNADGQRVIIADFLVTQTWPVGRILCADAPDSPGGVIGDQQRSIRPDRDSDGASIGFIPLFASDKAGEKILQRTARSARTRLWRSQPDEKTQRRHKAALDI